MDRSSNLLDEALGLDYGQTDLSSTCSGRVVVVEDCVETSGAFVLHHLVKRSLSPLTSGIVIFVALAHPFAHYDRILRKMGCNLLVQKDHKKFLFLDMLMLKCPDGDVKGGLVELYGNIQKAVAASALPSSRSITIMVDDLSLMEVAANGSSNHVLDFLHYCHTLTTEFGCSLIILSHEDIYSTTDRSTLIVQVEYLAEIIIKVEPLATGLATDVHGQLTVINQGDCGGQQSLQNKKCNFHFRVRENTVECFYPGSQT
ncbi:hypothetical protein NMG60_11036456 [Bertholletia excelsa]